MSHSGGGDWVGVVFLPAPQNCSTLKKKKICTWTQVFLPKLLFFPWLLNHVDNYVLYTLFPFPSNKLKCWSIQRLSQVTQDLLKMSRFKHNILPFAVSWDHWKSYVIELWKKIKWNSLILIISVTFCFQQNMIVKYGLTVQYTSICVY